VNIHSLGIKAAQIHISFCLLFMTACGGGYSGSGSPSGGGPPPTGGSPPSGSEFLYQFSFGSAIQVSTLNTASGALSAPIEATPYVNFENQGVPALATPSGKFVYAQGFYQSPPSGPPFYGTPVEVIWGYAIDGPNGTLTSLPSGPVPQNTIGLGFTPNGMVMDPQGKFLYVSVYNGVNNSGQSQNSIMTFAIDPSTGALTNTSTLSSTSQASLSVKAVDPSDMHLYASSVLSNGLAITAYAISPITGALTEIPGSPFFVVSPPQGIQYNLEVIPGPSGKFIFAPLISESYTPPGIFSFSVDATTNALTVVPGAPFPVGAPASIRLGSAGNFLFAAYPDSTNISVFAVDALTGTISPMPTSSTSISSYFGELLIDPSGQFLIFNDSINTATSFAINSSTGALTRVAGSPFSTGTQWSTALIVRIP
jgi:6-phosphogluconolactonase (cycloisomerase 2 family)